VEEGELMPYIAKGVRESIDSHLDLLVENLHAAGDLNYAITRIAAKYLLSKGLNYAEINDVAGVFQKVAAEFDARVTRPYEDLKIWQNGDIPEYAEIAKTIDDLYPRS
jgi:hypothetical protein